MQVATRAGVEVTQVATKDIMEIIPGASMDSVEAAQRRRAISWTSTAALLFIRIWRIAPNSARRSGRRIQLKRPEAGSSPGLNSITPRLAEEVTHATTNIPAKVLVWNLLSCC